MLRRIAIIVFFAWVLAGCGNNVVYDPPPDSSSYLPEIDPDTPGNGPQLDTGNGQDGALLVDTAMIPPLHFCVEILSASGDKVTVADAAGINPERRLVIQQVQDDFVVAAGEVMLVDTTGRAGQNEVKRVAAVAGTTLTMHTALTHAYSSDASGTAQACTLPEYTDVTITASGSMLAPIWDGTDGGFVGFYANGTVTLDGFIDVDASGFWGGQIFGNSGANDVIIETTTNNQGGGKGEGLDIKSWDLEGRGAMANAGGGGNAHNAGGGGGGNGGAGGFGGRQTGSRPNIPETRGRHGGAINTANLPLPLLMGGGGGAGQQDDNDSGEGGAGGGVIFFQVKQITGSGTIQARGGRGFDAGEGGSGEGAGGGGAGGTIWARALGNSFTGTVTAHGGTGGDHVANTSDPHGCGGGGGGGVVLSQSFDILLHDIDGGPNGVNTRFGNDPWDSGPGLVGFTADVN